MLLSLLALLLYGNLGCWLGGYESLIEIRQREKNQGDLIDTSDAPETELPTWFTADRRLMMDPSQEEPDLPTLKNHELKLKYYLRTLSV